MNKKFTSLLLLSSVILITTADKTRTKADTTDSSIEQQENIINEAQSAKDKSLSDISLLQSKIDGIRVEKNKTEQKISEIKKQAQNLNNKIEELSKNIEKRTDVLESQARSAQVNSNATNYVDTIVNSKSLSDIIQRLSAMATISSANKSMLSLQIKEQKDLNNKSDEVKRNYIEYDNLVKNQALQEKDLTSQEKQLKVASLNYQSTIETAQDKKENLLKQKSTAEKEAKIAQAEKEKVASAQKSAKEAYTSNSVTNTPSSSVEKSSSPKKENTITSSNTGTTVEQGTSTSSNNDSNNSTSGTGNPNYNPYAGGGCTDFVWQYFAAKGIYIANIVNGNGGYWGTNGVSQGVLRRTNLAPGVITSGFTDHFTGYGTSTTARTSPYGHVAVVTGVNPDGTFNVQEAGYGGTFPWGNVRTNISPENVVFLLPN